MSGSALIGHTGFVGGTLYRAGGFDTVANSKSIGDMRGGSYDLVVCAGVPAVKWLANKEPEADRQAIAGLTAVLDTIEAREFVLISTIDVYPDPAEPLDEGAVIDPAVNHAYGRHRYELEQWIGERFANHRVVRLPALFGQGLKKNVIFDLVVGNATDAVNPASVFQWYPLRFLPDNLTKVREEDIRLINLFPESIRTSEILGAFFPDANVGQESEPAPRYALRTKYSDTFGGPPCYLQGRETVMAELAAFLAGEA